LQRQLDVESYEGTSLFWLVGVLCRRVMKFTTKYRFGYVSRAGGRDFPVHPVYLARESVCVLFVWKRHQSAQVLLIPLAAACHQVRRS